MTGKEACEMFNACTGWEKAVPFEEMPPLYQEAWNDVAAKCGQLEEKVKGQLHIDLSKMSVRYITPKTGGE